MRSFTLLTTLLLACGEEPKESEPATEPSNEVVDTDGDGVIDTEDAFPDDPNECVDSDGDGVGKNADCDDEDASLLSTDNDRDCDGILTQEDCDDQNPDSTIVADDGDCDGTVTVEDCNDSDPDSTIVADDLDCDGTPSTEDCNDQDASISPTAIEVWYDGVDQNCDGLSDYDQDDDGEDSNLHGGNDCDDTDATSTLIQYDTDCDGVLNPEDCSDGIDNDGNGTVDCFDSACGLDTACTEDCTDGVDNEGDGLVDCEDSYCFTYPTCFDDCDDGIDNEGDGLIDCEDDECWGTASCTSGYTLIQESGFSIFSFASSYQGPLPTSPTSKGVAIFNVEGILRVPTGDDSFVQCSWTVPSVHHWTSPAQSNFQSLNRNGLALDSGCPYSTSTFEQNFLGNEILIPHWWSSQLLLNNSNHNQSFQWYELVNPIWSSWNLQYSGSYSQFTSASYLEIQGDLDPNHKVDICDLLNDADCDGTATSIDCDDNNPQLGNINSDQNCDGIID